MGRISPRQLGVRLVHAVFPDRCVLCGAGDSVGPICGRCTALLPRNSSACRCCAQPLPGTATGLLCAACQATLPAFAACRAPLLYAFPVDSALKSMKFRRQLCYAPAFGALLLRELEAHFADSDALLPVPLHRMRHAARGFNQARELCRPLRQATGLPLVRSVRRIRATPPQSGLEAALRQRNLRGAFAVRGRLRCRRPVIVDDIMTTGHTCNELARLLLRHGAEEVRVLVVARA